MPCYSRKSEARPFHANEICLWGTRAGANVIVFDLDDDLIDAAGNKLMPDLINDFGCGCTHGLEFVACVVRGSWDRVGRVRVILFVPEIRLV